MSHQFESITIKKQKTPEPRKKDFQNLGKMQENLRIAAHTIEALQQERDRLKLSFKSIIPRSPGSCSREGNSEELGELKSLLEDREKNIEKLEKQLFELRLKSTDSKNLHEKYEKLKKEALEKEKNILRLEKIIRELKPGPHGPASAEDFELKENDRRRIEGLQREILELQQVQKNWKKVVEIIGKISLELIQGDLRWVKGKNDLEMVFETIFAMKSQLDDNETVIKSMMKNEEEKVIKELREINRRLMEELENKRLKAQNPHLLDLQEASSKFFKQVQQSPGHYLRFKKHLLGFNFLRSLIEKDQHSEALLRVIRFAIDALEQGKKRPSDIDISDEASIGTSYTPREKIHKKIEINTPKRRVVSPDSQTGKMLSTWTQTKETDKSKISSFMLNKVQQTSSDKNFKEIKPPRTTKDTKKIAENEGFQPSIEKYTERLLERPAGHLEQDGYIKLFDESEQLLTIIDKQSSRLSKINSQISNLVPAVEKSKESSSESSDNELKVKYIKPPRFQYDEGTFGKGKISLNTDSDKLKGSQNSERLNSYIKLEKEKSEMRKGYRETAQFEGNDKKFNVEYSKAGQSSIEKTTVLNDANKEIGLYFDLKASSDDFNESLDRSEPRVSNIRNEKSNNNLNEEGFKHRDKYAERYNQGRAEDKAQSYWNSVVDYFSNQGDESK